MRTPDIMPARTYWNGIRYVEPAGIRSFGWALEQLKDGARVCREGWNGKGMWIVIVDD